MAQQSARRGRKNQMYSSCLEHAFMIWFRSANSHTGPQLHRCIRGRTDGSIRQRANPPKKPLALGGASTDEYTPYPERVRRYCPFERRGQGGDIARAAGELTETAPDATTILSRDDGGLGVECGRLGGRSRAKQQPPLFRTFQVCPKDRLIFPRHAPDASNRL